jgi:hypothetical protein
MGLPLPSSSAHPHIHAKDQPSSSLLFLRFHDSQEYAVGLWLFNFEFVTPTSPQAISPVLCARAMGRLRRCVTPFCLADQQEYLTLTVRYWIKVMMLRKMDLSSVELHQMMIWGEAKADNTLIRAGSVLLIDFGGGYTPTCVDKEHSETENGDWQGYDMIVDFLRKRL